jgi:hypothetical protein
LWEWAQALAKNAWLNEGGKEGLPVQKHVKPKQGDKCQTQEQITGHADKGCCVPLTDHDNLRHRRAAGRGGMSEKLEKMICTPRVHRLVHRSPETYIYHDGISMSANDVCNQEKQWDERKGGREGGGEGCATALASSHVTGKMDYLCAIIKLEKLDG